MNTYGYALQNPVRYTDPEGLFVPFVPLVATATEAVINLLGIAVAANALFSDPLAGISGGGADPGEDSCEGGEDPCEELLKDIVSTMKQLTKRYFQICRNRRGGFGPGYVIAYDNLITRLRNLVEKAEALSCPIPVKAYKWLGTGCPSPGTNTKNQPPPGY